MKNAQQARPNTVVGLAIIGCGGIGRYHLNQPNRSTILTKETKVNS